MENVDAFKIKKSKIKFI